MLEFAFSGGNAGNNGTFPERERESEAHLLISVRSSFNPNTPDEKH